ncbi:MAG TPA: glutamate formimidoyltransferase [Gemmatimonadaceae bacterium]|nr:glutamate formimidoyltransferase [Gemmatimonadaceae bacterium]
MTLVECVPNFSEGRRPNVIEAIRDAIARVAGVTVLDVSADASHNRSVITFVGPPDAVVGGAFAGIAAAREHIDLRRHTGVHPRIGAADVVPFVPLRGVTMDDCVALARALGERVGGELEIPVYLYERAATRPSRIDLADIRRGGFEALRDAIATDPARAPDFGPPRVHPSFGAVAIGARPILVAYNIHLGPESNLEIARLIARTVRESSGGLPGVKALALPVAGQAQLSMNLVDLDHTSIATVYDTVRLAAAAHGMELTGSEIVGLVPEREILAVGAAAIGLAAFSPDRLLEHRLREAMPGGSTVAGYLSALGDATPAPGGGSAAAHAGALAAALARMVAATTARTKSRAADAPRMRELAARAARLADTFLALARRDEAAYTAVVTARRANRADPADPQRRADLEAALLHAAEIPLDTARLCADAAELAAELATSGHRTAATDAVVGALLAEAACRASVVNVRVNVSELGTRNSELLRQADALVERASAARKQAERATG